MAERLRPYGVAAALLIGLSPSLAASVEQLASEPRLYYVVLVLALLVHLVWRMPRDEETRLSRAFPWVLAAIVVQLLAEAGGFPRFSRFALPLGLMAYLQGVRGVPLSVALLTFLCIPPPHVVANLIGIDYANLWSEWARGFAPRFSGEWVAWDGGVRLMALAAGVVVYRCLQFGVSWGRSVIALACSAVAAVLLQILAFALAGWAPDSLADAVFVHGTALLTFVVFLFVPFPGIPRAAWTPPEGAHAD